jgi:hypothetical protein
MSDTTQEVLINAGLAAFTFACIIGALFLLGAI